MQREQIQSIREHLPIPPHIAAAARACTYDLLFGPSWSRIPAGGVEAFTSDDFATYPEDLELGEGDTLAETYVSAVADALRDFIRELPGTLFLDWHGYVMDREPGGEWLNAKGEPCGADDDGAEWYEAEAYYAVSHDEIVEALFGPTIAKHFDA